MPAARENARKRKAPAAPRPVLTIEVIDGPTKGQKFTKQGDALQIGRTKSSAVYIKDPAVSQKHARIEWTGSAYTITDLGSSNGTTVNEKEIDEDHPVEIGDGDVIIVGTDTTVKVSVAAAADQISAEPQPQVPAKQPRGAAARAAAAAKREAEKARREEAAAKAASAREAKRVAAARAEEAARDANANANASASARLADRDESVTVEAFLTETAERLIGQIRDLAEAEVVALRKETEAVKAELRAECAAAA